MPEPQPGTDRPVDGTTPHQDQEPAVTNEPTPAEAAVPRTTGSAEAPTTPAADDQPTTPTGGDQPTTPAGGDQPTTPAGGDQPTTPAGGGRSSASPGTREFPAGEHPAAPATDAALAGPSGTRKLPAGETPSPAGTRKLPAEEPAQPPAPRWSGSAAVPPPAPRQRAWGESAEPTPIPPSPTEPPEHLTPVDPWAGADTGGWELPSTELPELPPLPPSNPYPSPAPTRPYSGPPAPAAHPTSPPAGYPVSPPAAYPPAPAPAAYPASPAPAAYPASPAPAAYAAPPVSPPPAYPSTSPVSPPGPSLPPPARSKRWRRDAPPPAPPLPPPGRQAPKGYAPGPARKRRKWPWVLLFTLACCCGCPAYWATPMVSQYPASATLPAEVADLRLRQDDRSSKTAGELEAEVRKAHWLAEETFAGVYTTRAGKRVTVFGGTGFRVTPESDADAEIARLTEQYSLGEPQVFDTGVRGRHERCAIGRADGTDVVVCTSVDHGSIATAVFTRLSVEDSAALLGTLREQIVTQ